MIDKPSDDYSNVLDFHSRSEAIDTARSRVLGEQPRVPDYTVLRHIGSGTFGDVWLVRNDVDRQFYAMKTLLEGTGVELSAIREFKRRVADHPNVVPIGHVGESNGITYYIMPLADNTIAKRGLFTVEDYEPMTLAEFINRNGKLSASMVVEVGSCILKGLEAVHLAGAIHRDIRPENIMLFDGEWRLADPGLLASLDEYDSEGRSDSLADSSKTHKDLQRVARTLERIYDLCEDPAASKHVLMEALQRAQSDEIDPNRFHSAKQFLESIQRAKISKRRSCRIPLLIATHLMVAYVAIIAGWQFAESGNPMAEQLYEFPEMQVACNNAIYEARTMISGGETIFDVGFGGADGSFSTAVYVTSSAEYELSTRAFFGCERGVFSLKVDGEQVGESFDMYAPEGCDYFRTVYHNRIELTEGWHTVKYSLVSVNKAARATNGGFVNLRMTPIAN